MQKKAESWWSFAGVIALALILPVLLRGVSYLQRMMVGAEGRLAAIGVEVDHPTGPMPQPWRAVVLNNGLDDVNRLQLRPEYVRIDHMFDQYNVVSRGSDGGLVFNWADLDAEVDKIASLGAKPFFSLSYMPLAISNSDIWDQPKDWNDWATVVQKAIEHYSGEKGIDNVYYEVWNEPDVLGKWTMGGSKDYKNLYLYAARGANSAMGVKPFKLGGPATSSLFKNWTDGFFPYVQENGLRMDFFSWHQSDTNTATYDDNVTAVDKWLDSSPSLSQIEKVVTEVKVDGTKQGGAQLVAVSRDLMQKAKYGFSTAANGSTENGLLMLARLGETGLSVSGEGSWVTAIGATKGNTAQVLVVNSDPKGEHSEVVPVTFLDLTSNRFVLNEIFMDGTQTQENVATSEAVWQKEVPLTPNSAVLLELTPKL